LFRYLHAGGHSLVYVDESSVDKWSTHLQTLIKGTLVGRSDCQSYFFGSNIPGKVRYFDVYFGRPRDYLKKLEAIKKKNFEGFIIQ
jgi:hypothetical protein